MTAGSCSVILLCPTRWIFCCQLRVVGSSRAKRGGKGRSLEVTPGAACSAMVPAERASDACKLSTAAAKGSAAAPVFKKLRRLSIGVRYFTARQGSLGSSLQKPEPLIQFPDPDVAEAQWRAGIAVRLQLDGRGIELLIKGLSDVPGLAFQLKVIHHQHAIKECRHVGWCLHRTVIIEGWGRPDDVVDLPFAGLASRVGQRNALLVDTSGHLVDVSFVVVGIENLQFISGIPGSGRGQKQPAVPPQLAAASNVLWYCRLLVQLIILE